MPLNMEFGRRFTLLLEKHGLEGEEAPYLYLEGIISKSTLRNWKRGHSVPDPRSPMDRDRVRRVISRFPGEDPEEWLRLLGEVRIQNMRRQARPSRAAA